jgi:hypothetical protein
VSRRREEAEALPPGPETGRAIVEWLTGAVDRLARDELDESVWFLHCRGGIYRFSVTAYRQESASV